MEINLNRDEMNLIIVALYQKSKQLENECACQTKMIKTLKNKRSAYDITDMLKVANMIIESNSIELENYLKLLEKLKKL